VSSFCPAVVAASLLLGSALPAAAQWTHRYKQVGSGHHVYLEGYELPTLTAGPMDAAVSPDGTRIAVAERGWLWLVDRETRVARQLTSGGPMDSRPRWSADGERILFVRDDGADTWIAEVEVATGSERVAANTDAIELDPAWGPDGAIWYASGASGPIRIWRLDPTTGERTEVAGAGRVARRPSVTPDGTHLLYLQKGGGPDRIILRDLATGEERSVVEGAILSQTEPALSPDGRHVAYQVPQGHGDGWELRVASLDRPGATMLLAGGADRLPLAPSWSPDGRSIWFSEAGPDEVMRLYRVPLAGGSTEEFVVAAWDASRQWGRVRLVTTEAGAGAPVAARVSVRDAEGHPLFPRGRQPRFDGQNGRVFFYSDGVVEIEAPGGETTVTVARGLAVAPVERRVTVAAGTTANIVVNLEPVWDAAGAGWRSGDEHFHLNYGGPYRLHPDDMDDVLAGEALDVAAPLVANLHERLGEQQWFGWTGSGEVPIVRFGQEVRSHFLGHIGLIGTDELFWPWVWGPGYQVYGQDDRTNAEVTAFARRQGGLASYVHPSGADPFVDPRAPGLPNALVADGILGDVQAMEIACLWTDELGTAEVWYQFLNLGWPVAATSGSDVMLNFYRTMAPGSTRTYVHTGEATDFDAYLEGLKAGRSFVTNGPLLEFRIGGAGPGGTTQGAGGGEWTLDLYTAVAVSRVEIIVNGEVAWSGEAGSEARQRLSGTLEVPAAGWIAARVVGPPTTDWPAMDSYAFAHTSPVWIGEVGSIDSAAELRSVAVLTEALAGARAAVEAAYAGSAIPELTARFDAARVALEDRRAGGVGQR
jgi:TolB protein